jgi:hypothetical protein
MAVSTQMDAAAPAAAPTNKPLTKHLWTPPERPSRPLTRRTLHRPRRKRPRRRTSPPPLRFSPTAWAKLLCLRDLGPTEIGGFGIAPAADLLYVEDVRLVRQSCTSVTVAFDDAAVADFFDEQIDLGRRPEQFARIWLHTHPGDSPFPSGTDEETFARVFGRCDWSVMFILAQGGATYARLQFRIGPGAALPVPVRIDWGRPFGAADEPAWEAEYLAHVRPQEWGAAWERRLVTVGEEREPFLNPPLELFEPREVP